MNQYLDKTKNELGFPEVVGNSSGRNGNVIEIDVFAVLFLMLANWWKILLAAILSGALVLGYTYHFVTPCYTANSSIYIVSSSSNSVIDLTELQIGSNLSEDYLYLMKARPLMATVAKQVGNDQTWKTIRRCVSVSNSSGDRIITISATTSDPTLSADIANALAEEACEYLPDVTGVDTAPNVIETALVPTEKSSPSYSKNTLIGMLCGAVLVIGILFFRYIMNDTFITGDDIANYFGLQPLAVIPEGDMDERHRKKHRKYGSYYRYYNYYGGYGYGGTSSSKNKMKELANAPKKEDTGKEHRA